MDMTRIKLMVIAALYAPQAEVKQWYLNEIAEELGVLSKEWHDLNRGESPNKTRTESRGVG